MEAKTSRRLHIELTLEEAIALEMSTSWNPDMDVNSKEAEIVDGINEVLQRFIDGEEI